MNPKGEQLYLKPNEAKFISMAVVSLIEQIESTSKDQRINWNPETRKDLKDMREIGSNLKIKLKNMGFDMRELPPFIAGDEDEFLTKES
jgi:hypothetical protein